MGLLYLTFTGQLTYQADLTKVDIQPANCLLVVRLPSAQSHQVKILIKRFHQLTTGLGLNDKVRVALDLLSQALKAKDQSQDSFEDFFNFRALQARKSKQEVTSQLSETDDQLITTFLTEHCRLDPNLPANQCSSLSTLFSHFTIDLGSKLSRSQFVEALKGRQLELVSSKKRSYFKGLAIQ